MDLRGMPSIYGLTDESGELRYIGKANCPEQRLKTHMRDSLRRDTPVYRWIRKNGTPAMVILSADCEDWVSEERRLIAEARARGDRLLNVADGGDEPHCPADIRAENGRRVAAIRADTPRKARLYELKRDLASMLKRGQVSEATRAKIRAAAITHPEVFGQWANV